MREGGVWIGSDETKKSSEKNQVHVLKISRRQSS